MARILFINTVCNGSTGTICKSLYKLAEQRGYTCCIAYGRGDAPEGYNTIKIGANIDVYSHALKARIFDSCGFESRKATENFLKEVDIFKPDIIHLHNIHGYYINVDILFNYLKSHPEIKKVWTLHDSWAYTGHCAYYLSNNCYKWQKQCEKCEYVSEYPNAIFDNSKKNYLKKKKIFLGVTNLSIVCVSQWLKDEVKKSFLQEYECIEIVSGIDLNIFKKRSSNFRQIYNISEKEKIVLGVAQVWDRRKGLNDFIELRKRLSSEYVIVLVGLNEKQIQSLPKGIIGIKRTKNQTELVEIYSAADVFFNPTKEETFGLTNIEAQACGTMTCSYDAGGTKETIINNNAFLVKDISELVILLKSNEMSKLSVQNKVREHFDADKRFMEYIHLYDKILNDEETHVK